jgi:hypothetical protein
MGFGFGFNVGPLRWSGSIRGGGFGGIFLPLIIFGLLCGVGAVLRESWIEIGGAFLVGVVWLGNTFLFVYYCHLSRRHELVRTQLGDGFNYEGWWWYSWFSDFVVFPLWWLAIELIGFKAPLNGTEFSDMVTRFAVWYQLFRIFWVVVHCLPSLLGLYSKTKPQRLALKVEREQELAHYWIAKKSCSSCGGIVRRKRNQFYIFCKQCQKEHSHLNYPELVDAEFQQELARREEEGRKEAAKELARKAEIDVEWRKEFALEIKIKADNAAEHRLVTQLIEKWRKRAQAAMNDVDAEVRKVLNPSPGDIVDEVALRHVFKAAEKSLEVTDSRLEQKDEFTNYLTTQKRVLEDLMTAIKSQTGLNLSGIDPATIENSGA